MALKLLQPGVQPLGQFDCKDGDLANVKGGEGMVFAAVVATSATDKAAYDDFDGYINPNKRAYATLTIGSAAPGPIMLSDDGISGYGTLFGTVVGGTVGQQVTGGTVLGPHTALGSGKVTLWCNPGLYAISLDAVDTNANNGIVPTNTTLTSGTKLFPSTSGVFGTSASTNATTGNGVCRFVQFDTNQSLVNTPNQLVAALNSPSGNVTSALGPSYTFAVVYYNPALA